MDYTIVKTQQFGLEVWIILDVEWNTVSSMLSEEGAKRKVIELKQKQIWSLVR